MNHLKETGRSIKQDDNSYKFILIDKNSRKNNNNNNQNSQASNTSTTTNTNTTNNSNTNNNQNSTNNINNTKETKYDGLLFLNLCFFFLFYFEFKNKFFSLSIFFFE